MAKQHTVKTSTKAGGELRIASVTVACLACLLGAAVVHAEEDVIPLYLTMSQVMEHDNNLLRDNANRVGAVVSSTKVRAGLDKNYGRQHYQLNAELSKNRYMRNESYDVGKFDNDSHTFTGVFDTEIGSDFRWNVNGRSTRSLPAFENSSVNRNRRNIMDTRSASTDLRYGLHGRMSVNAGFSGSTTKFDVTEDENRKSQAIYGGLRYVPNELMYFGLVYTRNNTDYPLRDVRYLEGGQSIPRIGEEVTSDNLGLNAAWQVTGFSRFAGAVGYTDERYRYDRQRDFNGLTGSAAWKFTPAGKITYDLKWARDTNNSGSGNFLTYPGSGIIPNVGYNVANRVTNTYSASASYAATAKLEFSASYNYIVYDEEISQVSVLNGNTTQSEKGRYTGYTFGADYTPIDSLAFGCSASFYERTASVFQVAYDGRSLSCYAAFTLQ